MQYNQNFFMCNIYIYKKFMSFISQMRQKTRVKEIVGECNSVIPSPKNACICTVAHVYSTVGKP